MYYKEDFSLKCNKNNCTGIIIAQYHSSSNMNSWSNKNIKIKFYNEKKNKQYVAVIDMSEIAQAYKLEESFIYVKIDRYYRYSKKQMMYLVNLYKKFINYCILNYAKQNNIYCSCAIEPYEYEYYKLK